MTKIAPLMISQSQVSFFSVSRSRRKYIKDGAQKVNPEMNNDEMIPLFRERGKEIVREGARDELILSHSQ